MALARIITRSQTCSQELSLVLIERGYTVEIVSPDKIPTNIADLELRVDAGPGNQLLANVQTHGGERSASLEFVHHLKAPMVELTRRPPELGKTVDSSNEPGRFNKELGGGFKALAAGTPKLISRVLSPVVESLPKRALDFEIDPEEEARTVTDPVLSLPLVEPPAYFAVEGTAVSRLIRPRVTKAQPRLALATSTAQRGDRSEPVPWRAALAFAGLVLLAVVLGFSMQRGNRGALQSAGVLPVEGIAARAGVNSSSTVGEGKKAASDPAQISPVPWPLPAADSYGNSGHPLREAQIAEARTSSAGRAAVSHRRGEDVVAPNTIIYFDKRYEPAPKTKRPQSRKKVHL
jgi:hypothetical protein